MALLTNVKKTNNATNIEPEFYIKGIHQIKNQSLQSLSKFPGFSWYKSLPLGDPLDQPTAAAQDTHGLPGSHPRLADCLEMGTVLQPRGVQSHKGCGKRRGGIPEHFNYQN